jgi:predicted Fe-Mo cluster-binding NifX family protein
MRVAISTDGIYVSEHFGRCPVFTIVEFEDGKLISKTELDNPGHSPGAIPKFLHENRAQQIISGGMGQRAQEFFNNYGIEAVLGISGKIDDIIDKLLKGTLTGGRSTCKPGGGKDYGIDKTVCDHTDN